MPADGGPARPLAAKLGLKPGMRALLLDPPPGYLAALGAVATQVELCAEDSQRLDFIQLFATERVALEAHLPRLAAALDRRGALWLCWPKRTPRAGKAPPPGDLRERDIREAGLA
ncbi:MAG: DUF3052 domain-containing protein, partial [Chloroflexota bacterium]|nr:DUF3052 domain-containing protein [Chloroflexota bacterium]